MQAMDEQGDAVDATLPAAGEKGSADDSAFDAGLGEVIIGEIPDAGDLTRLLWTARCTVLTHGLLGTFATREAAESAKRRHLLVAHAGRVWE
jgi:hypothetical protein